LTPQWDRSCKDCCTFVFDNGTGAVQFKRDGLPMLQDPNRLPSTPCHKCEKIPAHVQAIELTEQNRQAWRFYRACRAVNSFPDDPLVFWYSEKLRDVYDHVERSPAERMSRAFEGMAGAISQLMKRVK
jgi:hypothetical protein